MAGQIQKQRIKRRGRRTTSLWPVVPGGLLILVVIALLLLWALNVMEVIQGPWSKLLTIIFSNLYALIGSVGAVILAIISANNKQVFQKIFPRSNASEVGDKADGEEETSAPQTDDLAEASRNQKPDYTTSRLIDIVEVPALQMEIGKAVPFLTEPPAPGAIFFFNEQLPRSEEFYGRALDYEALLTRVRRKAATSLVGPSRIGKTWLMERLLLVSMEAGSRYRIGYVDATLPECKTVTGFTAYALEQLGIRIVSGSTHLSLTALSDAVDMLAAEHLIPVLCIDKFGNFGGQQEFNQDFFSELRAISQKGLGLVTASKKTLFDIVGEDGYTSGLFNIFETRILAPFGKEEAQAFVQAKGAQANLTSREKKCLLDYAWLQDQEQGGWPPLRLQLTGKMLLEEKLSGSMRPNDKSYWLDFKERLETKYRMVVRD